MNPLLRLYPAWWRQRYGAEMSELLIERPLSLGERLDLMRGALDAHRQPSLVVAAVTNHGTGVAPIGFASSRRVHVAPFLGTLAGVLYSVAAASILAHDRIPHIAWLLTNSLAAVAAAVLGLAIWSAVPGGRLAWVGGLLLMATIATLPWMNVALPSIFTMLLGSSMLVAGSLVEGRPSRPIGVLMAACTLLLGTTYFVLDLDLWSCVAALAGYGIVGFALAWSRLGRRSPIIVGALIGVLVVGTVALAATLTSPRILHEGYALLCGDIEQTACLSRVDTVTATLRARHPGVVFTYANVDGDGVWICARPLDDPEIHPCWNEHAEIAGWMIDG